MRYQKLIAGLVLAVAAVSQSSASMMTYVKIIGQKQGWIKGDCTQKGREDLIMCIAADHDIVSPRDPQSGLPTGKRMHKPFVMTFELSKATPLLYSALVNNENLTSITIQFWTPEIKAVSGVGSEVQSYTVKLVNANIASIRFLKQNIRNPELVKYPETVEVSFTYQKIQWTWNDGGITAGDDWENRN